MSSSYSLFSVLSFLFSFSSVLQSDILLLSLQPSEPSTHRRIVHSQMRGDFMQPIPMLSVRLNVPLFVRQFAAPAMQFFDRTMDLRGGDYRMRKRHVNLKTIPSRSKAILSGDGGDTIKPKESEGLFWSELVRLPTGSCLECQNQNIKARHHTWHHPQGRGNRGSIHQCQAVALACERRRQSGNY